MIFLHPYSHKANPGFCGGLSSLYFLRRTMNMVLQYQVKGMMPLWEFEGEALKVFES